MMILRFHPEFNQFRVETVLERKIWEAELKLEYENLRQIITELEDHNQEDRNQEDRNQEDRNQEDRNQEDRNQEDHNK